MVLQKFSTGVGSGQPVADQASPPKAESTSGLLIMPTPTSRRMPSAPARFDKSNSMIAMPIAILTAPLITVAITAGSVPASPKARISSGMPM